MDRIYKRTGIKGPVWYLDYFADGRRIRRRFGPSRVAAEAALANIQAGLGRVVVLTVPEFHSLLAAAGDKVGPRLRKRLAGLKAG